MKNNTSIKVPKKYQHMISEICHDWDGWWIYTKRGFYIENEGQHVMSYITRKELEHNLRTVDVCHCEDCETGAGWGDGDGWGNPL